MHVSRTAARSRKVRLGVLGFRWNPTLPQVQRCLKDPVPSLRYYIISSNGIVAA